MTEAVRRIPLQKRDSEKSVRKKTLVRVGFPSFLHKSVIFHLGVKKNGEGQKKSN
jgi:hypothetical protein